MAPRKKKSWRDVIPIHPAADVFPLMSDDELLELARDIRANTLQNKVSLWEQLTPEGPVTYLLDGRNRLDAMERAGIPTVNPEGTGLLEHLCDETSSMSSFTAGGVIVALNIKRRHLTPSARATLAARALLADKELLASFTKPQVTTGGEDSPPVTRPAPGRSGTPANKSIVAEVAEAAKVDRKTARKAINDVKAEKAAPKAPAKKKPTPKPPKPTAAEAKAKKEAEKTSELITGIVLSLTSVINDAKALGKRTLTEEQHAAVTTKLPALSRDANLAISGLRAERKTK